MPKQRRMVTSTMRQRTPSRARIRFSSCCLLLSGVSRGVSHRTMKKARSPKLYSLAASAAEAVRSGDRSDVRGLLAARAFDHLELDALVLLEGLEALALNLGVMGEEILAAIVGLDEAVALLF